MRAAALGSAAVLLAVASACGGASRPPSAPAYTAAPAPRSSAGAEPWPAPADALTAVARAGLVPTKHEFLTFHIHAHLDVFVNGRSVEVPSGLGINISDPGVKHGKLAGGGMAYGGISECQRACISPLHTHDPSGLVHVEAGSKLTFRLGQFFTEWNVPLGVRCVGGYCGPASPIAVFVNGRRFGGDPSTIVFADHQEIAIVIGSPPAKIPVSFA